MTECNPSGLLFSSINRQKVVGDFEGGRLTSDAADLAELLSAWGPCE